MSQDSQCPACGGPRGGTSGYCERCILQAALGNREEEIHRELSQIASNEDRRLYVEEICKDSSELRDRVQTWLRGQEGNFAPSLGSTSDQTSPMTPPSIDGRYRLMREIGEGGFGTVYLAEQTTPARKVALKILKLGMDTRQVVARFELERQTLALMDHPGIAKVFDAGATESGRPYFVMELVQGVPITQFCHEQKLSIAQRLILVEKVCQAVQHAHQKGVIHRDLKPSNILVAIDAGVPLPKVIDFGIAKAIDADLGERTLLTQEHQFLGTPAYISPEQAASSSTDVDTRSDIYSLGVLLYEILTGSTPFDTKELLQAGIDEMRRIIRAEEPVRPSTRIAKSAQLPDHRQHAAKPKIDADLDWIVMKCLRKDRTERYATANGLAMDIQRYLAHEPVTARPPSALYRLHKAVRRNGLAVLVGLTIVLALAVGVIISTREAIRATHAEREQVRLRQEVEAELNRRDGEFEAKHGHWDKAVRFYQRTIELIPSNQEFYHDLVPLLAELENLPLYNQTVQQELARFGQTTDPRTAERMTKDCLILPTSQADPEVLNHIAEIAVRSGINHVDLPWFQLAKGLAEYRCGRYTNAVEWLEKALTGAADVKTDPGRVYVQVQGQAVLAMAQGRLGKITQARATLDEARSLARERLPQLTGLGLNDYWPDSIYAELLIRQAATQLANP